MKEIMSDLGNVINAVGYIKDEEAKKNILFWIGELTKSIGKEFEKDVLINNIKK